MHLILSVHAQEVDLPPMKEITEDERRVMVRMALIQSAKPHLAVGATTGLTGLRRHPVLPQNYWRDLGKFFKSSCYHIDLPDAKKARKGAPVPHMQAHVK